LQSLLLLLDTKTETIKHKILKKTKTKTKTTHGTYILWCETTVVAEVAGDTSAAADIALDLQILDQSSCCCCCCWYLLPKRTSSALLKFGYSGDEEWEGTAADRGEPQQRDGEKKQVEEEEERRERRE
jgi:hypothetical protein